MNIKTLYDLNEQNNITIDSYLQKCGIQNADKYKMANTVEPTTHYDNIDEWCKALRGWFESSNRLYLLEDS